MNYAKLPASNIQEIWKDVFSQDELETLEKEHGNLFTMDNLVEDQKNDISFLKNFLHSADGILERYQQGEVDRLLVEETYCVMMDILSRLARRFHPLTTYGKNYLKQAISIRKKFEEEIGLLFTIVDNDNLSLFSPLLTSDLAEDVKNGKTKAIGVIRSDEKTSYGVGILLYRLEDDPKAPSSSIFRIVWLYIANEWKNRGIANSLIGELAQVMASSKTSALTVDLPENGDIAIMGNLLSKWHFTFSMTTPPDFLYRLSDANISKLRADSAEATPLAKTTDKETTALIHRCFNDSGYQGYLLDHKTDADFFDKNLSCFTAGHQSIRSLALVHRYPSGLLSIEYTYFTKDGEKDFPKLLSTFLANAYENHPASTHVRIPFLSGKHKEYLDQIFPNQPKATMIEGTLIPLPDHIDFKADDFNSVASKR